MSNSVSALLAAARAHRFLLAVALSLVLLLVLVALPEFRGQIWSIAFVDILVIVTVVGAIVLALLGERPSSPVAEDRPRRLIAPERLMAIVTAVAIFVTYASFRNQARLAAETFLNTEGQMLFEMEMANPNLRCLYTNFAHDDPNACLQRFVSDPKEWSAGSFYVEGVIWLLERSRNDQAAWGSIYSEDVDYWREYVNEDPTGLFSYYLVSFNQSPQGAREAMGRAGLDIPDFCRKYRSVHTALERAGAKPAAAVRCV